MFTKSPLHRKDGRLKIYSGTSGYAYKEWKGIFYPEKIPAEDMLHYYSERLGTVEINNTFYRMPSERLLSSWARQVPEDFVFSLKAPQVITHLKQLRDVEEETAYFFRTLPALGKKLGSVLFQFPKSFRADPVLLKGFIALVPASANCAFEFRSPSWLTGEIFDLLHERGFSLCIADTDENPAGEITTTASWGYLRLRRQDYTDSDLAGWIEKIRMQKWKKAFVYFKHEEEAAGAQMAMRFQEIADSRAGKQGKGNA